MNRKASFLTRFVAMLIDGILLIIIAFIIAFMVQPNLRFLSDTALHLNRVINFVYFIFSPIIWAGYTFGKNFLHIRIVKMDGTNPTFTTMLLRVAVAGVVYVLTLGIGLLVSALMVGLTKEKRAIHDYIADTCVINS